eukprot:6492157-Amphidinium_carterae.5
MIACFTCDSLHLCSREKKTYLRKSSKHGSRASRCLDKGEAIERLLEEQPEADAQAVSGKTERSVEDRPDRATESWSDSKLTARAVYSSSRRRQHEDGPLRLGRPPVFAGDEATYKDWVFKLKAFMGQESANAVQWMHEMESAAKAIDFDLYVEEKKREAVPLCFRLVVLTDKTRAGYCQAGWKLRRFRSLSPIWRSNTLQGR